MKTAAATADRLRLELASRSTLEWTLRVGAFLCFVGHGAFGIITKAAWLPYFAVADIGPSLAYRLMPAIGTVDITVGIVTLLCPIPAIGVWMTLWAIWTALLRPLSGESPWEAMERAGNYGVPLALLLLLQRPRTIRDLIRRAPLRDLDDAVLARLRVVLTIAVAFVLVGHGALGVLGKAGQIENYASIMSPATAAEFTRFAGAFEILLAAAIAIRPSVALLFFVFTWKLGTESLFLAAGASPWEVVERGGSYAAPIALVIVTTLAARRHSFRNPHEHGRSLSERRLDQGRSAGESGPLLNPGEPESALGSSAR